MHGLTFAHILVDSICPIVLFYSFASTLRDSRALREINIFHHSLLNANSPAIQCGNINSARAASFALSNYCRRIHVQQFLGTFTMTLYISGWAFPVFITDAPL